MYISNCARDAVGPRLRNVCTARMQDALARVVVRRLFSPVEGWTTLEAVATAGG